MRNIDKYTARAKAVREYYKALPFLKAEDTASEFIITKINSWPIKEELKADMLDFLRFSQREYYLQGYIAGALSRNKKKITKY